MITDIEVKVVIAHVNIAVVVCDSDSIVAKVEVKRYIPIATALVRTLHVKFAEDVVLNTTCHWCVSAHFDALIKSTRPLVDIHAKVEIQIQVVHVRHSKIVIIVETAL